MILKNYSSVTHWRIFNRHIYMALLILSFLSSTLLQISSSKNIFSLKTALITEIYLIIKQGFLNKRWAVGLTSDRWIKIIPWFGQPALILYHYHVVNINWTSFSWFKQVLCECQWSDCTYINGKYGTNESTLCEHVLWESFSGSK